jgi:hypothetical protein
MVKILGQLLIWCSLAIGAMTGATAYLVTLDLPDDELVDLTLAASAGKIELPDGTSKPLVEKDRKVTRELLVELRNAGVRFIRVKEFSLLRWREKWFFLLAVMGLLVGAVLTRLGARPEAAEAAGATEANSPSGLLHAVQNSVDRVRSEAAATRHPDVAVQIIAEGLGKLQKTEMAAFVEARKELTSLLGLSGYAAVMDRYAAAERQINRAWSAAVDNAYDEAKACLDQASDLVADTRQRLATGDDF